MELRAEAFTGCGDHGGDIAAGDAKTRTAIVVQGHVPQSHAMKRAMKFVKDTTNESNSKVAVFLGNVIHSLSQDHFAEMEGVDETVCVLGRSELELLRFLPRVDGEIDSVDIEHLDRAAQTLVRPPMLFNSQGVRQPMDAKWTHVYTPNMRQAMELVVASYDQLKAYLQNPAPVQAKESANTSGLAYDFANLLFSRDPQPPRPPVFAPAPAVGNDNHAILCTFSVAMSIKFFYMWRTTLVYAHDPDEFLQTHAAENKSSPEAVMLVEWCMERDILKACTELVATPATDNMRHACTALMKRVSNFMNDALCDYMLKSSGVVGKLASHSNSGEPGKEDTDALWLLYEDNFPAVNKLPVGCTTPLGATGRVLHVEWQEMELEAADWVRTGQRHLRELLEAMCSRTELDTEMLARLSGYVALAHSETVPGVATHLGQAIYGTHDQYGSLHTHTVAYPETQKLVQSAAALSVGPEDVGVVSWCRDTAYRVANLVLKAKTPDDGFHYRSVTNIAPFGDVKQAQQTVHAQLESLQSVLKELEHPFEFMKPHQLTGRMKGCVYHKNRTAKTEGETDADAPKIYRVTEWANAAIVLLPEPWVQLCFADLAARIQPSFAQRPFLAGLHAFNDRDPNWEDDRAGGDFWVEHSYDQLCGLPITWAQIVAAEAEAEAESKNVYLWILALHPSLEEFTPLQ